MLITCWSSKGGNGTTVVAAVLASVLAAQNGDALLVDLAGDLPAVLGLPQPLSGLTHWTGDQVEVGVPSGLHRLEIDVGRGVRLVPRGPGPMRPGIGPSLARALAGDRAVVVDAGVVAADGGDGAPGLDLAAAASTSLLVLRPCFLALRRAAAAPIRPSGVVLVDEPHRSLGLGDIESALGTPVVAVVPWDPAVARRVDAGLLWSALPRGLTRALRRAA